jgi:hypothetical protein
MTHRCARCGEHKPLTEFYRQTSRTDASSDNRGGYCKPCQRAYRAQNRERTRAVKRAWRYRTNYGLTLDDFEALYVAQQGQCAICDKPLDKDPTGAKHSTNVDHDHQTGEVRGLLCSGCNFAIGVFNDQPERLHKAANYLTNPPAKALDLPLKTERDAVNVRELHLFDAA